MTVEYDLLVLDESTNTWVSAVASATTLAALIQTVNNHNGNTSNPHNVTAEQIALGNVQNFGVATQAEAEAGTSATKYMTPHRTKQAIDKSLVTISESITDLEEEFTTHKEHNAWLTATLQNGWTGAMYFTLAAHSNLRIKAVLGTGAVSAGTVIATLPIGYRPTHTTVFLANVGGTESHVLIAIINDGTVRLYNNFEVNMTANSPSAGIQFNEVVNLQQ